MSSDLFLRQTALRRSLPWALWSCALAIVLAFSLRTSGFGTSPAVLETRSVALKCPRTPHRLTVEAVMVAAGDPVKEGQVLARMDASEVERELAVERAKLRELELQVPALSSQLQDEHARTADRLADEAEKAALDLARVMGEAEEDRSELLQLDKALDQEQKLVADGLSDFESMNELKLKRAALSGKVAEFRAAVQRARARADGTARRLSRWRKAAAGTPAEGDSHVLIQVAPAQAAAEAQRELVRQMEVFRSRLELKAPFDGRVGQVFLRPGDIVAISDQAVLTVVDDRPTTAIAYVDQRWARRIRVGDRAELIPRDRLGPALTGQVTALAPSIGELPLRFWKFPNMVEYGRSVFIQLGTAVGLPGQAFDVSFRAAETRP